MRHSLCAIGAALLAAPAIAGTQPSEGVDARIGRVAERFAKAPITGMTIAVSRDGKIIYVHGFGEANIAAGQRATADTIYEIGSITKTFTAAGIMRLAEQGRLNLDDPVLQYFPALGPVAKDVTIRHLLSHSSGLYSGRNVEDLTQPTDPNALIGLIASKEAEFEPGSRFRYNNNGYILLGLITEKLSGKQWGDYVRKEFFLPLGLRSTDICGESRGARVAVGYRHPTRGPAVPAPFERHHPTVTYSAGAICSTAGDLLKWQEALENGRVVSARSLADMATPTMLKSGKASPYGLGLFSDSGSGEPHHHHGGASSGFITQLGYFPKDRTGVVVLTNGIYSGAIVEQMELAVLHASRGEEDAAIPRIAMSAADRQTYVGTYDIGPMKVEVYEQGDDLRAQPGDQVATRLIPIGDDRFVAEHDPDIEMDFVKTDGAINALILKKNGKALPPGKRVDGAKADDTAPKKITN